MSNLNESPHAWLTKQFECEFCPECGGDARHHTAVPFLGNWFARCDFPPRGNGTLHPHIAAYRKELDAD